MKTNRWTATVCMMMLASATAVTAAEPEFAVRWQGLLPAKSEDWSSAGAFEAQMRFLDETGLGIAFTLGVSEWSAKEEYYEEGDSSAFFSMAVSGNLTAVPVGVSLMQRMPLSDRLFLTLEAGVRYVFCDSDIVVDTEINDSLGQDYYRETIHVDDTLLGVVGGTLEGWIGKHFALTAGLGYQWDLVEPAQQFQGKDIGPTSLQAATVSVGFAWMF